jgi:hypothetical protein
LFSIEPNLSQFQTLLRGSPTQHLFQHLIQHIRNKEMVLKIKKNIAIEKKKNGHKVKKNK